MSVHAVVEMLPLVTSVQACLAENPVVQGLRDDTD